MPRARITSKGQITIPKSVRERLRLEPGDMVDFAIEGGGQVVMRPTRADIRDLKGILHRTGQKAPTVEDMKRAVRQRAARGPIRGDAG
jgi:AbrB family looped-hinge helix DNA binding protein